MNIYAKMRETEISNIKPQGWLGRYLEIQKDGLTGHLEAAGSPFDRIGWGLPKTEIDYEAPVTEEWWPYEQTGYWIDGMTRCGYLLGDTFLINKARQHIDHVLDNSDKDGYLGPEFLKEPVKWNRWVHAVFFRAIMAHYSATGDKRVLPALKAHYLSNTSPHSEMREVCNIEEILWTYERTGDENLLEHAKRAYEEFNDNYGSNDASINVMLSDKKGSEHGVTFNEIAKLGAIMYIYTGEGKYLEATVNAYKKIDRDQMLIDGVCSSSEHLRGKDPLDSHETCDIADYTWSIGYLLMATGDAEYADKIERACLNAAPGAVRSDFKGLQYFSSPNQVVADKASNHNRFFRGSKWMSYRPNPGTECCPGEVNRIMPNYAARMWMRGGNDGIAAVLYGPSCFSGIVGNKKVKVNITEDTYYPFSDRIDFSIQVPEPVSFPLILRIPGWCKCPKVIFNGKEEALEIKPGTFVKLEKEFHNSDRITLILPMELKVSHWPQDGIGIERGPLVYSLYIEEDWNIDEEELKCTKEFPAWDLYPASPWNYALDIDEDRLDEEIEIKYNQVSAEPWSIHTCPVELWVPARKIKGWKLEKCKSVLSDRNETDGLRTINVKGNFLLTPQLPDVKTIHKNASGKKEKIRLIPYGCTKLRVTIFPKYTSYRRKDHE